MDTNNRSLSVHPLGECGPEPVEAVGPSYIAETYGGRIRVEWDPDLAMTPQGQLVFFADFLKTADLFAPWVEDCPLRYASNNAPQPVNVLGTLLLSVLAGHTRYTRIATVQCDGVNPELLGMTKVVSVDSARRAFVTADAQECRVWQHRHLRRCTQTLLEHPWILDVDTTVKPLYGHQEGAVLGYNPKKPGRPSHVLHTYFVANTRLVLDVEVRPGNESAAQYTMPGLWSYLDELPRSLWPVFLRGDCSFGNERDMNDAEERELHYLFKLRQSSGVKTLIGQLFARGAWVPAGQGWEGAESTLRLMGWTKARRVIVLRRRLHKDIAITSKAQQVGQTELALVEVCEDGVAYEYAVLVTSLPGEICTLAQQYRDRADAENIYDELKNQWGWGGYTTQDMHRCQVMARVVAQVYNWWSLYVGLALTDRHAEACTSRPLLLHAIGRQTRHAGQTLLTLTSAHAYARKAWESVCQVGAFLAELRSTARQLTWEERWRRIVERAFARFLSGQPPPNRNPLPAPG